MISIRCACGRRLTCQDEWAGKAVRCPACSAIVQVPDASPAPPESPMVFAEPAPEPTPAPPGVESWVYPPKSENFLLVLTDDSLWCHWLTFKSLRPMHEQLQKGENPLALLENDATRIPLAVIKKLELDKTRSNLEVHYQEKDKNGQWVERFRQFFLDDAAMRDDIVQALRKRIGGAWASHEESLSPMRASLGHFVLIGLTLIAVPTLLFVLHWLQGEPLLGDLFGGLWFRIGRGLIHLVQAVLRWFGVWADYLVFLAAAVALVVWIVMIVSNFRTPPLLNRWERSTE